MNVANMNAESDVLSHLTTYSKLLLKIIYSIIRDHNDSMDVLQNTYLKAVRAIQNGKYVDQGFLRAWLCQIARNESVTYLKNKSQKTADVSLDCSFVYDTYATNPSCDGGDYEQITNTIRSIVSQRGEIAQSIFDMFFLCGETMENIAITLDMPHNTIKSVIYRMRHEIIPKGLKKAGYSDDDLGL